MKNTTGYFREKVLEKRPYLTIELCREVINCYDKKELQSDGRIKYWKQIKELDNKYLRVVTLEDNVTIHNAFLDRGYKEMEVK